MQFFAVPLRSSSVRILRALAALCATGGGGAQTGFHHILQCVRACVRARVGLSGSSVAQVFVVVAVWAVAGEVALFFWFVRSMLSVFAVWHTEYCQHKPVDVRLFDDVAHTYGNVS